MTQKNAHGLQIFLDRNLNIFLYPYFFLENSLNLSYTNS